MTVAASQVVAPGTTKYKLRATNDTSAYKWCQGRFFHYDISMSSIVQLAVRRKQRESDISWRTLLFCWAEKEMGLSPALVRGELIDRFTRGLITLIIHPLHGITDPSEQITQTCFYVPEERRQTCGEMSHANVPYCIRTCRWASVVTDKLHMSKQSWCAHADAS